jgi:hypothetical protein
MSTSLVFNICSPSPWTGRYARIPGDRSVFHLQTNGGRWCPVILWRWEDGLGTCVAIDLPAVRQLTDAVAAAKQQLGGTGGGTFQINEFGQVLVPASDTSGRRLLVGELNGSILFKDPFQDDMIIDLGDVRGLRCGDSWPKPYVGCWYNLNRRSQIYFYRTDGEGAVSEYPPAQDADLIRALRAVRRTGPVRFIVNPYGVVLTKRPPHGRWQAEEEWEPVFVGRINLNRWFKKER